MKGSRWLFLFFVDAVLLCFACVETLCALELVHQSDVFYSGVLQFYLLCCAIQSVRIAVEWLRQCLERYLVSSSVLRLHCVLQLVLSRSHWNCYIMDAIWMLGFARNIAVFSGKRRFRCREKLARVCGGFGRRRFAADSCSICARSGNKGFQVTFSLLCWCCALVLCMCWDTLCIGTGASKRCVLQWCVAILLCCAIQSVRIAVEWLRQCLERYLVSSSVLRLHCVLQLVLSRSHWNCYIMDAIWMLGFARNIVFFRVNVGSVAEKSRLARATVSGVVALPWNLARNARAVELRVPGDFFSSLLLLCYCVLHVLRHFVQWNWCIKAMCCTVVRCKSFMFGNSVSADRCGMAASRFLAAAGACGILLCFAAESRKSSCNGNMKDAKGALAAIFSSFWRWWFSFWNSF